MRALPILLLSIAPLVAGDLPKALSPEDVGLSSERLEIITRTIEADVAAGRVAGVTALIARQGQVAYFQAFGQADREAGRAMSRDEIFRIYSMSKPITSAAVMMLFEEGKFRLKDKVSKYLPELGGLDVLIDDPDHPGDASRAKREKARRDMTVQDLLRHTSGLTYGYFGNTSVDQRYLDDKVLSPNGTLADMITKLGKLPLLRHPGEKWHYSVSVDVLGRLVEKLSGKRFDEFLAERIFEPLEMNDTGFHAPREDHGRFAELYAPSKDDKEKLVLADPEISKRYLAPGVFFSGGGGLVSTTRDYLRFCQMMLNGGELDGRRLLGRKTVELMTVDHVEGIDPERIAETGYGFGLGFAVHLDQAASGSAASLGEYNWGGAAGTRFWIDPSEEMIGVYMVQILPHSGLTYGEIFKQQAYQAIVD